MTVHLKITRPAEGFRDLLRKYVIEVNGQSVGKVGRGQSLSVAVELHSPITVRARIDWSGSPTWTAHLDDGETAEVVVSSKPLLGTIPDIGTSDGWVHLAVRSQHAGHQTLA